MKLFSYTGKFKNFLGVQIKKFSWKGIYNGLFGIVHKLKELFTMKFSKSPKLTKEDLLKRAWKSKDMRAFEELVSQVDSEKLDEILKECNSLDVYNLLEAYEVNNWDAVEILLNKGVDINEEKLMLDGEGRVVSVNLLMAACQKGDLESVRYLIKKGVDINKECYNIGTPLDIALKSSNKELIVLLLENFADINKTKEKVNFRLIQESLKKFKLNIMLRTMIQEGNLEGFEECLNILKYEVILEQNNINYKLDNITENMKVEISKVENLEISNKLLERLEQFRNTKIDLNKSRADLLVDACSRKYNYGIDFLVIEKGVDVNCVTEEGVTPLVVACYNGDKNKVERLLEVGADKDKEGCVYDTRVVCEGTPLIVATKMGKNDVARLLIDKGADIDKKYGIGKTALIYAVENENKDLVKTLLNEGALVNVLPMDRNTALMTAVRKKNKSIAKDLLDNGADVNQESIYGETALRIAIDNKDMDLTELLIDNFADLDILDKERDGRKGEFVKSVLDKGHIRFSVRSGDITTLRKQLSQYIEDKSDKYVRNLKKEMRDIDNIDNTVSNRMIIMLNGELHVKRVRKINKVVGKPIEEDKVMQ